VSAPEVAGRAAEVSGPTGERRGWLPPARAAAVPAWFAPATLALAAAAGLALPGRPAGLGRARRVTILGVRDFYEGVWAGLPEDPEPWAWRRRRALLLREARPGERVLDVGCGAGRFLAALRDAGADPVGVELAAGAVERARRNVPSADVRLVTADGSLPLGHGEIDLVWCSEVLEHVPDTFGFLTEVRRVLRRGGRVLVTVPDHGRVKRTLLALAHYDAHYDPLGQHLHFYTRRSLARALHATGFEDVALGPLGGPPLLRQALVARAVRG
jgi:SAM-dependent methyltransferase